ncbi:MAG: glycosyltransferase family 1 protein [Pseudomonadota bacterium]
MRQALYNLENIRPPLTGIGRYAVEIVRGGLDAGYPLSAMIGNQLLQGDSLREKLDLLLTKTSGNGSDFRKLIGHVPKSRDYYRWANIKRFEKLARAELDAGAVYHDLNYAPRTNSNGSVTTVYDVSHYLYPQTHPRHRVRYLERLFSILQQGNQPIITISNSVKAELEEHYQIPAERIVVTPLAADPSFRPRPEAEFSQLPELKRLKYKHYVLCVGTLEPRKNLHRVLDAYQALDDDLQQQFPLVIAGSSGWKSAQLERQIASMEQQGKLIKFGFVSDRLLPSLYAGAKAFVFPSLYEGFGLPLLEAMQSGCPCITSGSGALAELSAHHALQVDPMQASEIETALKTLLEKDGTASEYATLGLRRASDFSWEKTIEQTHAVYQMV